MARIKKALRLNGTNVMTGLDEDGRYTIHAGKKGQNYRDLPANPPSPDEIAALREQMALPQKEFADALGVSVSTVSAWELGTEPDCA